MKDQYIQGYIDEVDFCPYCGGRAGTYYADGACECDECGKKFYVIELSNCSVQLDPALLGRGREEKITLYNAEADYVAGDKI